MIGDFFIHIDGEYENMLMYLLLFHQLSFFNKLSPYTMSHIKVY